MEYMKGIIVKYRDLTKEALEKARENINKENEEMALSFLEMAESYYKDSFYFEDKGDLARCLAALAYAHGWLDAGARIGLFKVKDNRLFSV